MRIARLPVPHVHDGLARRGVLLGTGLLRFGVIWVNDSCSLPPLWVSRLVLSFCLVHLTIGSRYACVSLRFLCFLLVLFFPLFVFSFSLFLSPVWRKARFVHGDICCPYVHECTRIKCSDVWL